MAALGPELQNRSRKAARDRTVTINRFGPRFQGLAARNSGNQLSAVSKAIGMR